MLRKKSCHRLYMDLCQHEWKPGMVPMENTVFRGQHVLAHKAWLFNDEPAAAYLTVNEYTEEYILWLVFRHFRFRKASIYEYDLLVMMDEETLNKLLALAVTKRGR